MTRRHMAAGIHPAGRTNAVLPDAIGRMPKSVMKAHRDSVEESVKPGVGGRAKGNGTLWNQVLLKGVQDNADIDETHWGDPQHW